MDEERDYKDRITAVRAILAERLGADDDNSERFGQGLFTCGMKYGESGKLGDMVWTVSRKDDLLRRRRDVSFEWRAFTPEKVAEALLQAYEALGRE